MIRIFSRAIGDLADPNMFGIVLRSVIVTLLIFVALGLGLAWALAGADPCGWIGAEASCRLGLSVSGLGAIVLTIFAVWLLFPGVALGVVTAYSDRIIAAVEARHYPAAFATARRPGMAKGALLGLRATARLLFYNLLALPLYLLLLVTGVGTLIAFLLVNGLAIGRDYGEMVAVRHGNRAAQQAWLVATRGDRALIGTIVAAIFLVPIVNLFAPILGAAMTAHLFHARAARET